MSTLREHFASAAFYQAKEPQANKAAERLTVRVAYGGKTQRIMKQRKLANPEFLQHRGPTLQPGRQQSSCPPAHRDAALPALQGRAAFPAASKLSPFQTSGSGPGPG